MKPSHEVYLALGTNLGDRAGSLAQARDELRPFVDLQKASSIYETPPWGVLEQPAFLNQVLQGRTALTPLELLKAVKGIEVRMGRVPSVRYGPRLIDIDLLMFDDLVMETAELTLPHPRMLERAFVLVPLAEIAPMLVSPVSRQTFTEALAQADSSGIHKWEEPNA